MFQILGITPWKSLVLRVFSFILLPWKYQPHVKKEFDIYLCTALGMQYNSRVFVYLSQVHNGDPNLPVLGITIHFSICFVLFLESQIVSICVIILLLLAYFYLPFFFFPSHFLPAFFIFLPFLSLISPQLFSLPLLFSLTSLSTSPPYFLKPPFFPFAQLFSPQ